MKKKSIKKKLMGTIMSLVIAVAVLTTVIKTTSDILIRRRTEDMLIEQATTSARMFAEGQTDSINEQLSGILAMLTRTADYISYIYEHPEEFVPSHNMQPSEFPKDVTGVTFHWAPFTQEDVTNEDVLKEADMLTALEGEFYSFTRSCPILQSVYVATSSHINIGYDENVLSKLGGYNPIEANAQWYLKPLRDGYAYISDAYQDSFGRGLTVTMSVPYRVNGELYGVIGADIGIQSIAESILDIDVGSISSSAVLFSAQGKMISAKGMNESTSVLDVLGANRQNVIIAMKTQEAGEITSVIDGSEKYILFDTIPVTGWILAIIISVDDVVAPAQSIDRVISTIALIAIGLILLLLVAAIIAARRLCAGLTAPILQLSNDAAQIGDGNLEYRCDIHTGDEIEALGKRFEGMADSLKEYIRNITHMTAENERIGTELNVATKIQASMLPCIFPPFPDRDEFSIYATMNPAKEVGGDFYDYFMVDDTHLAIVMADVSGKGVPAALFMVIAKTLIKDHTVPGSDLGAVFTTVNDMLCESNSNGMFVTAFEAVLDLVTGELRFVNAGHETPFICRAGEDYAPYKVRAGFVLGGMEGVRYRSGVLQLNPGDKFFQYTDGVTEATDGEDQLFGMARLQGTLTKYSYKAPVDLLPAVKKDIDAFVGDAPQFDDITMLCLEYIRPPKVEKE